MEKNKHSKNNQKEELLLKKQPDHLLPLFSGKAAKQILNTINHSHIKPYTDDKKENTKSKIRELLKKKRNNDTKYQMKISKGYITKQALNILPPLLEAEKYEYQVPCLNVEISKEDNSPLEEEEINLLTDYLEKYYNNSKIVFK